MGANQSDIEFIEDLKRKYGKLKSECVELSDRFDTLAVETASSDQQFQCECTDIKNAIDDLKIRLRELKHDHTIKKQQMDEEQNELKTRMVELNESMALIKIGQLRYHRRSMLINRHP